MIQIKTEKDMYFEENTLTSFEDSIYDVDEGYFAIGGDWEEFCSYVHFKREGDKLIFIERTMCEDEVADHTDYKPNGECEEDDCREPNLIDNLNQLLEQKFAKCVGNDSFGGFVDIGIFEENGKVCYDLTQSL